MVKYLLLLMFCAMAQVVEAQRSIRILIINQSDKTPNAGKGFLITPLTGGGNPGSTNDAGLFDINLSSAKPGDRLDLLVAKSDYQILGPDTRIFAYAVPNDPNEVVRIAMIKTTDFNAAKYDFEAAIEKRIKQATAKLDLVIDSLQKAVNDDVRNALAKTIKEQSEQIKELRKNKEELASKLAQVDLEQASEFARLSLKKFKEEGDVKAALAMMPEDKLDAFWNSVLLQEEKLNKAREQGVENYMIRARLLIADFQFALADKNYQEAVQRDSNNVKNLWEVALFLAEQRQDQRAIQIYERTLQQLKTETDRRAVLNNLGNLYRTNQKMPQAEAAYNEALKIYRQLADQNPDAFLPDLAMTLNNLGEYFRINQKMPQAEAAFNEALKISRQLADQNPDAFLPNVATTLNNLGEYFRVNQKMTQAEAAFNEALSKYRQLADKKPNAFLPNVATTLNNLGNYYSANQKMPQAEAAYNEALKIRRQLADKNPDAFLPDVATTLNNLGNYYRANQKMPQAEAAFLEALSKYRQLADKNPDAFLPNVATTLNNLGNYHYANQKMPQAEAAYNEALKIRRQLADKNPDAFLPNVANTLNNLAAYYYANQKIPQAEAAYNEALKIRKQLADKNPNAFLPDLAATLNNLGVFYKTMHRFDLARRNYGDALAIYLEAVFAGKNHFAQNLGQVIRNLGEVRDSLSNQKDYAQMIEITQTLASTREALIPLDSSSVGRAAGELGSLAWHNLFVKNYPAAQAAAEKGLRLDPSQVWINTNLALSLLYQGKYSAAQAIYAKFKDQPYDEQGKTYREVFLQDLLDLEKEGITHPDVEKIRRFLKK